MKNELTLGSLFDGSGGFPLGGMLAGITPLWASGNRAVRRSGNNEKTAADEALRRCICAERR